MNGLPETTQCNEKVCWSCIFEAEWFCYFRSDCHSWNLVTARTEVKGNNFELQNCNTHSQPYALTLVCTLDHVFLVWCHSRWKCDSPVEAGIRCNGSAIFVDHCMHRERGCGRRSDHQYQVKIFIYDKKPTEGRDVCKYCHLRLFMWPAISSHIGSSCWERPSWTRA